jgi:hypothetical protein
MADEGRDFDETRKLFLWLAEMLDEVGLEVSGSGTAVERFCEFLKLGCTAYETREWLALHINEFPGKVGNDLMAEFTWP